jgi:hypothetical protein
LFSQMFLVHLHQVKKLLRLIVANQIKSLKTQQMQI